MSANTGTAMDTATVITTPAATKPVKLEDQIRAACRVRHYSLATERAYISWYKQFVRWAGMKHPATLGGDRVEAFMSYLAGEPRNVSASTQRRAVAKLPRLGSGRGQKQA